MGHTLFLILVALGAFTKAEPTREEMLVKTAPAYTIARYAEILNSSDCRRDLEAFRDGVDQRKLWAIKLLDANGAPGAGFLYGSTEWIGHRKQCYDITNTIPYPLGQKTLDRLTSLYSIEEQYPPFETAYFSALIAQNTSMTYKITYPASDNIILGICVPISCSTDDMGIILKKIFRDRILLAGDIYDMDFRLMHIRDVADTSGIFQSGKIICILMTIATLLAFTIIGTLYDLLVYQKRQLARQTLLTVDNNNTSELKSDAENDEKTLPILQPESRMEQVMMCFSVYANTKRLFKTSTNDKSISPLNGIKVVTMLWIILVHVGYYSSATVDNEVIFIRESGYFAMQVLTNASYSVDSFFCMSGFLYAYIFLKTESAKPPKTIGFGKSVMQFFLYVFKRFVRFTPTYMVVIALAILNFTWYEHTSTFNLYEKVSETCSKYWWMNILYISTLFSVDDMCLSWSWYLSNDMQFYIFSTILLLLSRKYFYPVMVMIGCFLIASISFTGYLAYIYNFVPRLDELYAKSHILYFPPWVRIPPYLVGVAAAFFLHKCNNTLHLKKSTLIICWSLAVINSCTILFMTYNPYITLAESVIYTGLGRPLWGVGTAWLIIACITNNAGIIKKIFGAKLWIPMSRLTYCVYLLNPFIIVSVNLNNDVVGHLNPLCTGVIFFGSAVASYLSAYVLTMIVEMPFTALYNLLMKSDTRRK